MEDILTAARQNTQEAFRLVDRLGLIDVWKKRGARANLVGSLANGLYMNSRDIDLHVYTDPFSLKTSFEAMADLASKPGVRGLTYTNLLDTDEACLEWHAQYQDEQDRLWQFDIIHIVPGSKYDGYFEDQARRVQAAVTGETRRAVLEIKQSFGDTHIGGVWVYQAVFKEGIRTPADFQAWYAKQDPTRILEW